MLNVAKELAAVKRMTPKELCDKYANVFGEQSRSGHKEWLVKRIIWRMQANEEGDLSERGRRRAMELANDAILRMKAPHETKPPQPAMVAGRKVQGVITTRHDRRIPMPGTVLTREYKGRTLRVTVMPGGFEYEGENYRSLSARANERLISLMGFRENPPADSRCNCRQRKSSREPNHYRNCLALSAALEVQTGRGVLVKDKLGVDV